jgi:hypothetical protein
VEQIEPTFAASGTELGATYELRYRLGPEAVHLELVGERVLELGLDGADFFRSRLVTAFQLVAGHSDRLLEASPARDYRMQWVELPSVQVTMSNSATHRRAVGGWQWRPTEGSWRDGSRGQTPARLRHWLSRPLPAGVALPARIDHPNLSTSTLDTKPGSLGQNGGASPPVLGPRNCPPEAGDGEVAPGRVPLRPLAGVPTTPRRPSRRRRTSTRAGRRRSSARPWP